MEVDLCQHVNLFAIFVFLRSLPRVPLKKKLSITWSKQRGHVQDVNGAAQNLLTVKFRI